MKKNVVFDSTELRYLKTAVKRMIWLWQAQRDTQRLDADKHMERYRRLPDQMKGYIFGKK
jgi:hypothetical protein